MDIQNISLLGTITVLVLIVLVFGWLMRRGEKIEVERKARLARARPAKATVVQIGKSASRSRNTEAVVKLRLEVRPPDAEAYAVTTAWQVPLANMSQLQQGQTVAVKIDADDSQIIYPNVSWAEFSHFYWSVWVEDKQKKRRKAAQ